MRAVTMTEARSLLAADPKIWILVTVRAVTRWSGREKNKRKLRGFDDEGRPLVYFGGWSDFVLRPREVVELVLVD